MDTRFGGEDLTMSWVQEHEGARCPMLVALCTRLCRCCLSNAQTRQVAVFQIWKLLTLAAIRTLVPNPGPIDLATLPRRNHTACLLLGAVLKTSAREHLLPSGRDLNRRQIQTFILCVGVWCGLHDQNRRGLIWWPGIQEDPWKGIPLLFKIEL